MDTEPEETDDADTIDFTDLTPERKLDAIFGILCDVMGRLDDIEDAALARAALEGFRPHGQAN